MPYLESRHPWDNALLRVNTLCSALLLIMLYKAGKHPDENCNKDKSLWILEGHER